MQPEPMDVVVALIPLVTLVGLLVLAAIWLVRVSRIRELKHQQTIAMIEKGLVPPPELGALNVDSVLLPVRRRNLAAERFRSGGVIVVGLGIALALIVGVAAGQARVGLGIGGAIVAFGVAMIVNGVLANGDGDRDRTGGSPPPGDTQA